MAWPYEFLELTKAEKQERRLSLDRHAGYSQLSALLPVIIFLLVRFASWVHLKVSARNVKYNQVPGSPVSKYKRSNESTSPAVTLRKTTWWLGDDVVLAGQNWGRRDTLIFGSAYTVWLLFLCVQGTGRDYFHLTKRFGAVAAAQFPIQYLLSLKYVNPVAYALRSSHEEVNRWHRVIGRIIYLLLCLHGAFYTNYYIQTGVLMQRLTSSKVVILGVLALLGMTALTTTAFGLIRAYSYRVFFITHLLVALALPPMIYFHVHHARVVMIQSLVVFLVDLAARKLTTTTAAASLELIPGTNLVKIVSKVPEKFISRFVDFPASHVYLSIPAASRSGSLKMMYEFMFNPFTVASVDENNQELTLTTETTARVDVIWALRSPGEATWATLNTDKSILEDDRVQLFLTGSMFESSSNTGSGDVELEQLPRHERNRRPSQRKSRRPDFQRIVDEFFRKGQEDRVAVFVCGSEGMARELRGHVGTWVKKGREVWWHNENFSW
ncbi:hypothetical protein E8E14_006617 [Neopestalotiopsis sp. 37M]|nr:hypothetical protein E8E14_006617 [Neopestalotiopsis sp. 37M]